MITLQCDSLQQLCPGDNQPRMCVCNITGNLLIWRTSTSGSVAAFTPNTIFSQSKRGFTAVLTQRANGTSVSTLTFNPSIVGPNGVDVTCEGRNNHMTTSIAVTSAGNVILLKCTMLISLFQYSCSWCSSA